MRGVEYIKEIFYVSALFAVIEGNRYDGKGGKSLYPISAYYDQRNYKQQFVPTKQVKSHYDKYAHKPVIRLQ